MPNIPNDLLLEPQDPPKADDEGLRLTAPNPILADYAGPQRNFLQHMPVDTARALRDFQQDTDFLDDLVTSAIQLRGAAKGAQSLGLVERPDVPLETLVEGAVRGMENEMRAAGVDEDQIKQRKYQASTVMGLEHSRFEDLRGWAKNRGLELGSDFTEVMDEAEHTLTADLGDGWRYRLNKDQQARAWAGGLLTAAVNLAEYPGAPAGDVLKLQAAQFRTDWRIPDFKTNERLALDLEQLQKAVASPTETIGQNADYRYLRALAAEYYGYLRPGAALSPAWTQGGAVPQEEWNTVGKAVEQMARGWRANEEQARAHLKWKLFNVPKPLTDFVEGKLSFREQPFYADVRQVNDRLAAARTCDERADGYQHALWRVTQDMKDAIAGKDPGRIAQMLGFLSPSLPEEQRKTLAERMAKARSIHHAWDAMKATLDPAADLPPVLAPGAAFVRAAPEAEVWRNEWRRNLDKAVDAQVQQQKQSLLGVDKEFRLDLAVEDARRARDLRVQSERAAAAMQEALEDTTLPKVAFWTMEAAHKALKASGISDATHAIWRPASREFTRQYLRHSGGPDGFINRPDTPGKALSDNLGLAAMDDLIAGNLFGWDGRGDMMRRFLERKAAGTAGFLDEIGVTAGMFVQGITGMPGLLMDNPMEFAFFDKVLHGWGRARSALAAKLTAKGVSPRAVAAIEIGMNPIASLEPYMRMTGWRPELPALFGKSAFWLRRSINKASPGERAKAAKYMESFRQQYATKVYELPETKLEGLDLLASAFEAKIKSGPVSYADVVRFGDGLIKEGLPAGFVRQYMLPFSAWRGPVGQAMERARISEVMMDDIIRLENTAGSTGAFAKLQTTPLAALVGLMQERSRARGASAGRIVDSWLGRRILSERQRGAIKQWAAKELDLLQVAPQLMPEAQIAIRAFLDTKRRAQTLARTTRFGIERARRLADDAAQAGDKPLAERHNRIRNELERELGMMEAQCRVNLRGDRGREGIEAGYTMRLTPEAKDFVTSQMVALVDHHGPEKCIHEFGFDPATAWRMDKAFKDAMKPTVERAEAIRTRLNGAVWDMLNNKYSDAAAKLKKMGAKVPKNPRVETLIKLVEKQRNDIQQAVASGRARARQQAARAARLQATPGGGQRESMFLVEGVEENLATLTQAMREWSQRQTAMAQSEHVPASSLELISTRDLPAILMNRRVGLMEQYVDSAADKRNLVLNKILDRIHELDPRDRDFLGKVMRGELKRRDPSIPDRVASIALDLGVNRNTLLLKLYELGKISSEQFSEFLANPYTEHIYAPDIFGQYRRKTGLLEQPIQELHVAPIANKPKWKHLKVQRSTRYVRQFYQEAGKLKEERFHLEDFAKEKNPARAAEAAARAWVQDRVRRRELHKDDVGQTVKAITDLELGALGLVRDTGLAHVTALRRLWADAARTEMFGIYAQLPGLARKQLSGVPKKQTGQWTQPLQGKEWGALEGMHVHRNLLRMINAWDGWYRVLETGAQTFQKQVAQLYGAGSLADQMTNLIRLDNSRWSAFRWIANQQRWMNIVFNPGSWINNHLGGMGYALAAGINPLSPKYWTHRNRFYKLFSDYIDGTLNLESAEGLRFATTLREVAHLTSTTVGSPERGQAVVATRNPFKAGIKSFERRSRQKARQLEEYRRIIAEQEAAIGPKSPLRQTDPGLVRRTEMDLQVNKEAIKLLEQELASDSIIGDLSRTLVSPTRSRLGQGLAASYGLIDASHKWAATQMLVEQKGWQTDIAWDYIGRYFQNYGAVPPSIRGLRGTVLGAFVPSFAYEAGRIVIGGHLADHPFGLLRFPLATFAWNLADNAASGVNFADEAEAGHDDTTFGRLREMFFAVHFNAAGIKGRFNLAQASPLAPFLYTAGASRLFLSPALREADRNFGVASVPAQALANFASNFYLNNPTLGAGAKIAGVDLFNQQIVSNPQQFGGLATRVAAAASSLFAPVFATRTIEELLDTRYGPSLITKHEAYIGERLARGIAGLNISHYTYRELAARTILKYWRAKEMDEFLREARDPNDLELQRLANRYAALDPASAEGITTAKEGARILQEKGRRLLETGARREELELDEKRALEQFVELASRNLSQLIHRTSLRVMPQLAYDFSTSRYSEYAKEEQEVIWQELLEPRHRDNIEEVIEAAMRCHQYSGQALQPALRERFSQSAAALWTRARALANRERPELYQRLLQSSFGNWNTEILKEAYRQLGLIY